MKIGFTGTQQGMTRQQAVELNGYLFDLSVAHPAIEVHHGDCIGADSEFHSIAKSLNFITYAYPANIIGKRAFSEADYILRTKPPLERNHDIVAAVDLMIATPAQRHEVLRSGTWATIRYARKKGVKVHIIYPQGERHDNTKK